MHMLSQILIVAWPATCLHVHAHHCPFTGVQGTDVAAAPVIGALQPAPLPRRRSRSRCRTRAIPVAEADEVAAPAAAHGPPLDGSSRVQQPQHWQPPMTLPQEQVGMPPSPQWPEPLQQAGNSPLGLGFAGRAYTFDVAHGHLIYIYLSESTRYIHIYL